MFEGTKNGNQDPWIEEGQTIQWLKGKELRDKQWSTKHYADHLSFRDVCLFSQTRNIYDTEQK
jgi:hypothetical protein